MASQRQRFSAGATEQTELIAKAERSGKVVAITIYPEYLNCISYLMFFFFTILAMILTFAFSGVDFDTTVIYTTYGFNNICVFYDFEPASYILPVFVSAWTVINVAYIAVQWMRMEAEVAAGTLAENVLGYIKYVYMFALFCYCFFVTVFTIKPQAADITLLMHTAPYLVLQGACFFLALAKVVHGIKSGYWERLDFPEWFATANYVYCGVGLVIVLAHALPFTYLCLDGNCFPTEAADPTSAAVIAFLIFDRLFLIWFFILPPLLDGAVIYYRYGRLEGLHITLSEMNPKLVAELDKEADERECAREEAREEARQSLIFENDA